MQFTADTNVLIHGIAEPLAATHSILMKAYGTQVVAGVSPGLGGSERDGIPVYDLVEVAMKEVGPIDTAVIFVKPYLVLDAALEAIAAGIRRLAIVTEGMPPMDMVTLIRKADSTETLVIGPSSPGLIIPGEILLGTHPAEFYSPGSVGLISRCGTLTYEIALSLTEAGLGQSIGVSIGGDGILGSSFAQWLQILDEDDRTEVIVIVGEIGGSGEEAAAEYVAEAIDKPVIAYVAGRHVPKGRRLGHAGAIAANLSYKTEKKLKQAGDTALFDLNIGTAEHKIEAFKKAGIPVAERPSEISELVKQALKSG
ncbi:CoA-binding protein [Phormidium yuhuli AB48]|uniref:CoA-binding protein n=1 Tax=Phormidium yuhuli AB48 TaxID=2940671 RepID=A0ABY5AM95_9CYAN|nr:CoA-binding protein [Phormidium yuhuli]USR90328.1 CoA-binding protein [Phormidium yuhuli AB48]